MFNFEFLKTPHLKKFSLFFLALFLAYALIKIQELVQNPVTPAANFATVKIYSYNLTNNDQVREKALASGTIIDPAGLVLTNHHVVTDEHEEDYEAFAICLPESQQAEPPCKFTAALIAKDKSYDIALLKIQPRDIEGNLVPDFPFLPWQTEKALPVSSTEIEVLGYPGIGGDTLTATAGQVSGYEEKEGIQFGKTDATIDQGNSGGTVQDLAGNFLGVPSYLISSFSTLGYYVPLQAIQDFLTENLAQAPQENLIATELLQEFLKVKYTAKQNQQHTSKVFPYYSLTFPKPWKLNFVNKAYLVLENTAEGEPLNLLLLTKGLPFDVPEELMQIELEEIERAKHTYTNYQREEANFKGITGYQLSFDRGARRYKYFLGSLQNAIFFYQYQVPLAKLELEQKFSEVLDTFELVATENQNPYYLQNYANNYTQVSLATTGDFYLNPIYDSQAEDKIIEIYNPNSLKQNCFLAKKYFPREYWGLSQAEIFEQRIKDITSAYTLVSKAAYLQLDGLPGFGYTYTYPGADPAETRKTSEIILPMEKQYFFFYCDDLAEKYDEYLPTWQDFLHSFQYHGEENQAQKGQYQIPQLNYQYPDIAHHHFETEIAVLAAYAILAAAEEENFLPEAPVNFSQVLLPILKTKIFVEEGQNSTKTATELALSTIKVALAYLTEEQNRALNYYLEQEIIFATELENYRRNDQPVSLLNFLRWLFQVFETPVWSPPYVVENLDRHYFYQAVSLGILDDCLTEQEFNQERLLKKGELASLLYQVIKVLGERNDF